MAHLSTMGKAAMKRAGMKKSAQYALGLVCSVAMLAGCGGSYSAAAPGATAGSVYVVQQTGTGSSAPTSTSILSFSGSSSGTVTPTTSITPPSGLTINFVGTDGAGNIYASAATTTSQVGEILVYSAGATGAATPARVLTGAATKIALPLQATADTSGQIYVADNLNGILVFAAGASGNVAPVRQINGALANLGILLGIAVDSSGNIYVADCCSSGTVEVFSSSANGNVAPIRTITGAATTIGAAIGLAVDSSGNLYVGNNTGSSATNGVAVFAPGANGNVAPIRTIAGSNSTLGTPDGLGVDAAGNIYVENIPVFGPVYSNSPSIVVFAAGASGNVAPARTFSSTQWTGGGDDSITAF